MATRNAYIAHADRAGVIRFSRKCPRGALTIIGGPSIEALRERIEPKARLAYDNKTLLVPGIPEAANDREALDALLNFSAFVRGIRLQKGAFL